MDNPDWGRWQVIIGILGLVITLATVLYPQISASTPMEIIKNINTQDTGVCYYDWKGTAPSYLNANVSQDYIYYMVTLYVKNEASQPVTINAAAWRLSVNGVEYFMDGNTFFAPGYQQPADITKGGEIETQLVYRIKGIPSQSESDMVYIKSDAPKMQRIKYY